MTPFVDKMQESPPVRNRVVVHLLLLGIVIVALYANTLQVPFVLDDTQIFANQAGNPCSLTKEGVQRAASSTAQPGRVLPNLTFALNTCLHGTAVAGYHWVNILVHLGAAIAFYFLAWLILATQVHREGSLLHGLEREIAFAAALLWAVHPLQTNAVTYIIQRMTSMAALFSLLAVFCYLKARLHAETRGRLLYGLLTLLMVAMALASKENSGILPLTLLGCELFLLQPELSAWRQSWRRSLGPVALAGIVFLLICALLLGSSPLDNILAGYQYRDFTLGQRLLTESRILWHYLSLIVLPLPARLNIAYDYPLSTGLFIPLQTFFSILGLAGLIWAMVSLYRRHHRLAAFAIFWFFINLVIESSVIPLMLIFEHRLYLPSTMVILVAVYWCYRLGRANLGLVRGMGLVVVVLFAFFTWQRNTVWQSELSLWSDVIRKSPALSWAYVNLGKAYAQNGEYDPAEQHLRRAIALDPDSGLAYLNLGVLYEQQNRLAEANRLLQQALERKIGNHALLLGNIALVQLKLGNSSEAARYANQAISADPAVYKPYEVLGLAALKSGDLVRAETVFQKALTVFPQRGEVYVRLATVYEKQNRLAEALAILTKAMSLQQGRAQVFNELGIVYWRLQRYPESIQAAQKAIDIEPGMRDAYLTLGISYEDSGQQAPAFRQFTAGWQRGLDMVGIYTGWADNFLRGNEPDKAILYLQEALKLEPGRAKTHEQLAAAYTRKGMISAAQQEKELARRLMEGNTVPGSSK